MHCRCLKTRKAHTQTHTRSCLCTHRSVASPGPLSVICPLGYTSVTPQLRLGYASVSLRFASAHRLLLTTPLVRIGYVSVTHRLRPSYASVIVTPRFRLRLRTPPCLGYVSITHRLRLVYASASVSHWLRVGYTRLLRISQRVGYAPVRRYVSVTHRCDVTRRLRKSYASVSRRLRHSYASATRRLRRFRLRSGCSFGP
jgi:hypothetical protein